LLRHRRVFSSLIALDAFWAAEPVEGRSLG
jgi:hypothetical protein